MVNVCMPSLLVGRLYAIVAEDQRNPFLSVSLLEVIAGVEYNTRVDSYQENAVIAEPDRLHEEALLI